MKLPLPPPRGVVGIAARVSLESALLARATATPVPGDIGVRPTGVAVAALD
eukprot:CAMPEP_0175923160 /NCGR_PEP_ID=MMETSP0108-20121206/14427_1 /TAXON_ID=195067 ORGANISM="Goniomonas pacifica, Strain CCMP1869" /NCGR_SAMPLE_ID=MMETSP0108 /ASSEMBLY_ACC=CAM_ASM_000204 /LENGTH=50 /DNA_ID=CAMNT_0017246151 /DNA_START=121 /DNA_END=270 /DNA_ORIENTATION=-